MLSISWKRYDDEFHLSDVLTDAARACVDAKAANPTEFLTSYFKSVSKGDAVQTITCQPLFSTATGSDGLRFSLRLFTNIESSADAVPLLVTTTTSTSTAADANSGEADVAAGTREAQLLTLAAYVGGDLQRKLLSIGVHHVSEWDAALRAATWAPAGSHGTQPRALPQALQHAMSIAAAAASAKTFAVPLYVTLSSFQHSGLHGPLQANTVRAIATSGEEHFTLPQLMLPFLGRPASTGASASAAPAGAVHLDTVFLMPGPTDSQRRDGRGVLPGGTSGLLPRLFQAYRALQSRASALTGTAVTLREDGAVVMDDFENLTDAVELAAEAVRGVGLEPGRDVHFGLRLGCPVTFAPSFGQSQAGDASSTTAISVDGGNPKDGAKKPAAAAKKSGGAGKQSSAQVEEIMYTPFAADADVTSAQLSAYVYQQVTAMNGVVSFLQDVHAPEDVAGAQRLQSLLGPSVCVSSRTPFDGATGIECERVLQATVRDKLCADVALTPMSIGTLSAFFTTLTQAQKLGRSVSLCAPPTARAGSLENLVDIAVSAHARFLVLGGLTTSAGSQSVTRYFSVMEALQQQRSLAELPAGNNFYPESLPPADVSAVPEIKRKADKRKRKGR